VTANVPFALADEKVLWAIGGQFNKGAESVFGGRSQSQTTYGAFLHGLT